MAAERVRRLRPAATEGVIEGTFAFDPRETTLHFVALIPRSARASIDISEQHVFDPYQPPAGLLRVSLPRPKWDAIAEPVRAHFNQRLKALGHKTSGWKTGANLMRRDLGKELVLLAWAIEDADPTLIPTAVANWLGLVPEERWWLYTQTAAATGDANIGRNRGWRKAVRFALTENPAGPLAGDSRVPDYYRVASQPTIFGASDDE